MTTTVGIRSKDGVVLAADKRASKGFFVGSKVVQKIFSLDGATAVAIAGAMSDAEYLVNLAKAERRLLALRRGYPLSVKESAKLISNIVYQSMKSYNPFYVELVVAGVDRDGAHVYTSDMSGAITSEDFMSSGSGSPRPPCGRRWNAIRGAGTAWTCSRSRTGMRGRRTEMAAEMGRMPFFYNQEGRLVQVDYALQAVSRGSTTLGLKTKDFAVLTSQVKPTRPLMEPAEKVFVVDDHIGATGSGYIGDVTTLLDQLRVAAQRHRLVYDEPIDVGTLSRNLSEYLHEFTMYAVRPFGASIIVAGVDDLGVQLIQVDPSGTTFKGSAFAIGQSSDEALETIVKGYRPDLQVEEAVALATQAIEGVNGGATQIEHGVVTAGTKRFEHRHNGNAG